MIGSVSESTRCDSAQMLADASNERLSKYELIRLLGSGGMGEVYLARDTVLRRYVAIKFVSPAQLADPAANARLLREARAAATLDHPGICPVHDVHVDSLGRACIVMQYVEGQTLADRLAQGAMEPTTALALAAEIADALAAAHAHGIVHRDLKPQNIMIGPDGHPRLLDFGIAFAEVSADAAAEIATRTATGAWSPAAIVGTPAYMSPEQVLRQPVDARSDLFSLGAVLFECLTGTAAFQAKTDIETWARVVYAPPPAPSQLNARVPSRADAAVATLLAKEPDNRYPSATDAAMALRLAAHGGDAPPAESRRRVIVAAIVLVAAFAGGLVWRGARPHPLPPVPADAQLQYDRGIEHLRNGAYWTAKGELQEALTLYPEFPEALARLAEAHNELDDEHEATAAITRLAKMYPNRTVLPPEVNARIEAIQSLVLRDFDGAVAAYQRVADANPSDRGVWLDLARVRQLQGVRVEAQRASETALKVTRGQYAAAHLRLASLAAEESRRDEATKEFAEAERLYRLNADLEGEAEATLQRADFLDAIGDFAASRDALGAVDRILAAKPNPFQQVRASLLRSSLVASSGDFEAARRIAADAVDAARRDNLDTVAARALIEAGTALIQLRRNDDARRTLESAIDLAKRKEANGTAARGTLQLASLYLTLGQNAEARDLAQGLLGFLKSQQYPRFQMIALSIVARSNEDVDPRSSADLAREVLTMAESLHDDREVALALEGLSAPTAALGSLPQALEQRDRLDKLLRTQQNMADLALNLTARAELLIRLGRFAEAAASLNEIDAAVARHLPAFLGRVRRVAVLRAITAAERGDAAQAQRQAGVALDGPRRTDTTSEWASAVMEYALATLKKRGQPSPDAAVSREARYWRAHAALLRGDAGGALAMVDNALSDIDRRPSAEFEWRMAAIGADASRRLDDAVRAQAMTARAQAALKRVRDEWKAAAGDYEKRADLAQLRRAAGIPDRP